MLHLGHVLLIEFQFPHSRTHHFSISRVWIDVPVYLLDHPGQDEAKCRLMAPL